MGRRSFAALSILVVVGALTVSAAGGSLKKTLGPANTRPSNAELVAAARASAPHLFSTFPGVMGKKQQCVLSPGWGVNRRMHGACAMWITFVHTPAFPEAHVSFQEVWPRGAQTWTIIERWVTTGGGATQKIQVLNTLWHGDVAGRLGK
jgi:hypothetical protein